MNHTDAIKFGFGLIFISFLVLVVILVATKPSPSPPSPSPSPSPLIPMNLNIYKELAPDRGNIGYSCDHDDGTLIQNSNKMNCENTCTGKDNCGGYSFNNKNGNCLVQNDLTHCTEQDITVSPWTGGKGWSYYYRFLN